MAPSTPDSQSILRPAMRRKSSAQNLLSSFKPGGSGTNSNNNNNNSHAAAATSVIAAGSSSNSSNNSTGINGTHAPPLLPPHVLSAPLPPTPTPQPPPSSYVPPPTASSVTPSSALPTPTTSGTSTPSLPQFASLHHAQQQQQQQAFVALGGPAAAAAAAATMREWDAQSLLADSPNTFPPPVAGATPGGGSPGATVEYLRDLVQKRIITLTYMRNVHDGRSHWFHTIAMSRIELDRVFNNTAMKKRTHRFAVLAMSLSSLFDILHPTDFLRSALNMLTEYEQAKEDNDRPKMRLWRRPPKRHTGVGDYTLNVPDTSDTYLAVPHMPFPLDYTQTLLSLLDILSALYAKLAKLLGPSPFPHASQHMLGLAPHPGVSYLFQSQTPASATDDALLNVALGTGGGGGGGASGVGNGMGNGVLHSPPPSWTPALGELVLKVDGKFKKIISVLLKDLDVFARNSIKDELASLDPLLRNVGGWGGPVGSGDDGGGRAVYDFDQ
ncbi:hypothetical protein H4582DRAFT_1982773 [Lactarius indigo]|nr:hypothetical protein H4582DRAFT_1982773 [Lactarius indigo]